MSFGASALWPEWYRNMSRPWCLPCTELGARATATELGVACQWHFGILPDRDQESLRRAVLEVHPRGGSVRTVIRQIWVVRVILRGQSTPSTVEAIWKADADEVLARGRDDEASAMVAEGERMRLYSSDLRRHVAANA